MTSRKTCGVIISGRLLHPDIDSVDPWIILDAKNTADLWITQI